MNISVKIFMSSESSEKFFGQGPYLLLHEIDCTGSLRQASINMNMAYTKAFRIIKTAEKELGFSLLKKTIGGFGGGGSCLTEDAKNFIQKYEVLRADILKYANKKFDESFNTSNFTNILKSEDS